MGLSHFTVSSLDSIILDKISRQNRFRQLLFSVVLCFEVNVLYNHSVLTRNVLTTENATCFLYNLSYNTANDTTYSHRSTFIHRGIRKCVCHGMGSFACWNKSFGRTISIRCILWTRLIIGWIPVPAFPQSLRVYSNITKSPFEIRLGDSSRITCRPETKYCSLFHMSWMLTLTSIIYENLK